jgi:hypothetical protein
VALLDNVKSLKFSWGELESIITSDRVSGKEMYVGEGSRPNTLTWFITLNGANLSTDMAQRSVIIKVSKPDRRGSWEAEVRGFVKQNRAALVADIIGVMRAEPHKFSGFTRWAAWEADILSRVPEPVDAQRLIDERRPAVDAEQEENEMIEQYFTEQLEKLDYAPEHVRVYLPFKVAADWFNEATGKRHTRLEVSRLMQQMCMELRFKRIMQSTSNKHGKGYYWHGLNSEGIAMQFNVQDRLEGK